MANTSNHGWEIPDVNGSKDVWGQILNDFFDDELDRQVKLEGLFADRPSAGSSSVKYYHATDRRIVYYNDGNTWEAVYGLGTDSNPVPGTSHFESISTNRQTINNYGALVFLSNDQGISGDDSANTVDLDTADFDSLDSFDSSNNQFVVPSNGTYRLSAVATWQNNIPADISVQVRIIVNGNLEITEWHQTSISDFFTVDASTITELSANDTVRLEVRQDSGNVVDIVGKRKDTNLSIERVA